MKNVSQQELGTTPSALSVLWTLGLITSVVFVYRSFHLAQLNMMWADEFCSWNLIADSSPKHAYAAWVSGADSGGILFYVVARTLTRLFGLRPLVIGMYSSFCFWSAAIAWWSVLRRTSSDVAALMGISTIWLGSSLIAYHSEAVRFYGQFFLAFSLLSCFLISSQRTRLSHVTYFCLVFILSTLLVLSHTLGLIYSAALLAAVLLCREFVSRWSAAIGIAMSWTTLFSMKATFKNQASIAWAIKPTLSDFLRYYIKVPFASKTLNILFYCSILLSLLLWIRGGHMPFRTMSRSLDCVLMAVLFGLPPLFCLAAQIGIPIAADRYLMPYLCGCTIALAYMFNQILDWTNGRLVQTSLLVVSFAILLIEANWTATDSVWYRPIDDLAKIINLPGPERIAINDTTLNYQLHYYYPKEARRIIMIFPEAELQASSKSGTSVLYEFGYLKGVQTLEAVSCRETFLAVDRQDGGHMQAVFDKEAPTFQVATKGMLSMESFEWTLMQVRPDLTSCSPDQK